MDCGCDDDDDHGLLGELNPDALQRGWMPRLTVDAGPDSCGGLCGRRGHPIDPNGDEDFPFVPPVGGLVTSFESETDPPSRDFLGVEGPAEGDENPCKSEEEACTQTLEDAGESATKWCDCVKPWVGDCVCMVFDNEPGEDDDDEAEGPGDGGAAGDEPEQDDERLDGLWGISVALPALEDPALGPILAGAARGGSLLRLVFSASSFVFLQPSFYCKATCPQVEPFDQGSVCRDTRTGMPFPPVTAEAIGGSAADACANASAEAGRLIDRQCVAGPCTIG